MPLRCLNLAVVLAVGLGASASAHAYCRATTEMPIAGEICTTEGIPLFWARQCLSYSVVPRDVDVPSLDDLRAAVDTSFATWSQVECDGQAVSIQLQQTIGTAECVEPEYNPTGPNANAVIFVSDWTERGLPSTAFGLTLVWHQPQTGEIFDADVQINDGELGTLAICDGTPSSCRARVVDIQNVVTHEVGHYLGLGHTQDDPLATMAFSAVLGEKSKRTLANDDREGLCAIYAANPPVLCEPQDFEPDNGFSSSCYFPEPGGFACGACSAPGSTPAGTSQGLARHFLALMPALMILLVAGNRWRRRKNGRAAFPVVTTSPKGAMLGLS